MEKPSCMPQPMTSLAFLNDKSKILTSRLLDHFTTPTETGFTYVISRDKNSRPAHQGDSLLWTSLAAASFNCSDAGKIIQSLGRSVAARNGALVRIEPLTAEYDDNATSRDQETGAITGLISIFKRCPDLRGSIRALWSEHMAFVNRNGKLYPGNADQYRLTPGFRYFLDQTTYAFGLDDPPGPQEKAFFETANVATATWTQASKLACYPIHLATLQLLAAELAGSPVKFNTYKRFCDGTEKSEIPLTDWYCRRMREPEVFQYLAAFDNETKPQYRYEYRHQRCGSREGPDMDPGEESPALDFLFFYGLASGATR